MTGFNELINQFSYMVENYNLSRASKILQDIMQSAGMRKIVETAEEAGCKIVVRRRNRVTREHEIAITDHAKKRTNNYLIGQGEKTATVDKMTNWLKSGKVMEYSDVLAYGYRPSEMHAESSIYIQLPKDLVAVLQMDGDRLVWITTYSISRTPRNNIPISQKEFDRICKLKKKSRRK